MISNRPRLLPAALAAALLTLLFAACATPAPEKPAESGQAKHEYKDLKAEVFPVPPAVKAALPGLQNDNIYLYREIFSGLFLVVYAPDYSREKAVAMSARAFAALAEGKDFQDLDFWIIQVQPESDAAASPQTETRAQVVVWGVRPEEAAKYKQGQDLASFLADSEYLLVDDEIVGQGPARLQAVPVAPTPLPAPTPGNTATPAPALGSTTLPDK